MPDDSELDLLLPNYLAGHLSTAERKAFEGRLAEEPALRRELALARRIWEQPSEPAESGDPDVVWARLRPLVTAPVPPVVHRRVIPWRIAAAIVVALGVGLVWRAVSSLRQGGDAPASREYVTSRGQRASFRLPDGTQVVLGPATRLRSSVARSAGPRVVTLDGEAYFVVAHDARRPFTVHTPHGVAKDLGTRFTVLAYAGEPNTTVAVAEGMVSLTAPGETHDSLVLAAGDLGRVAAAGQLVATRDTLLDEYFTWTEGRLEFHGTPLADVVVRLGRWYGLDIRLADAELRQRRLAASFREESAAEALRVIAATAGLRIEQQGKTVILHSK